MKPTAAACVASTFTPTSLLSMGFGYCWVDLCNHGQSSCLNHPIADDPAAQVKLAVDAARAEGAARVVLVSASLGGSVAVTAAGSAKPDSIVLLSSSAKEEPSRRTRQTSPCRLFLRSHMRINPISTRCEAN